MRFWLERNQLVQILNYGLAPGALTTPKHGSLGAASACVVSAAMLRSACLVALLASALAVFAPISCWGQLLPNPLYSRFVYLDVGLAAALITPIVDDISIGSSAVRPMLSCFEEPPWLLSAVEG